MKHNSNEKIFYCYVLLDPRKPGNYDYGRKAKFSHEPFYVGKGHGERSEAHIKEALRNQRHNHKEARIRKIISEGYEVIVVRTKTLSTESRAFARERELVASIGRRVDGTGPLTNLTHGGEGVAGYVFTEKDRSLLRQRCAERGLTRKLKYKGQMLTLKQLSALSGVNAHTQYERVFWTVTR